jgi:rubrerythrin
MEGGILAYNGLVAAGPPEAGVFCFPENMTPQELVAMAWYIEDGTQSFFDTIKSRSQVSDINSILTRLIEHKVFHKESLARLYQQIVNQPAGDNFPFSVLNKPPHHVMAGCVSVPEAVRWSKDRSMAEILDLMMALEANTLDVFLKLGRQVPDDRAKSTFVKLSEEEVRHLEQLASLFDRSI